MVTLDTLKEEKINGISYSERNLATFPKFPACDNLFSYLLRHLIPASFMLLVNFLKVDFFLCFLSPFKV